MTRYAPKSDLEVLQGTLDLLVLKALGAGPLHGWAISRRIRDLSSDVLSVNQGSLYPALYRLEERGWIVGQDAQSPEGRRIRVYRSTAAGRRQVVREVETWDLYAAAMRRVILAT
ncbi:MAG TPA: PadR family transcriptional regulator [Gemmatimonadales bacterium]|jgi:PadR family transcriptional regulator PadR|nr:PadR family transcriptional regulator [Gemmatimonadales bacterium]